MAERRETARSVKPPVYIRGAEGIYWTNERRRPYAALVARAVSGDALTDDERAQLRAERPASVSLDFHAKG